MASKLKLDRYRGKEGEYLEAHQSSHAVKIGWFFPVEQEFGLLLANDPSLGDDFAIKACRTYFEQQGWELPAEGEDFFFKSVSKARECIRTLNAQLIQHEKDTPLPEWAQRALEAGWKPPRGWKP